jgi:hypothetical protein
MTTCTCDDPNCMGIIMFICSTNLSLALVYRQVSRACACVHAYVLYHVQAVATDTLLPAGVQSVVTNGEKIEGRQHQRESERIYFLYVILAHTHVMPHRRHTSWDIPIHSTSVYHIILYSKLSDVSAPAKLYCSGPR